MKFRYLLPFVCACALAVPLTPSAGSSPPARQADAPESEKAQSQTIGIPWTGPEGVVESTAVIMDREARAKKKVYSADDLEEKEEFHPQRPDRTFLPLNPDSPRVASWPPVSESAAQEAAKVRSTRSPFTVGANFLGAELSNSGFVPPDSMGAAGLTQFLVAVNGYIKVFAKDGTPGPLATTTNIFFETVRGSGTVSDPRVRFDRLTNRWFLTAITTGVPNRILVAVSDGPEITTSSAFTFYQFQQDQVGPVPNVDTNSFADYDTLGVDANALYMGVTIFARTGGLLGTTLYVIRKSSVVNGGPIVVTVFRQVATPTIGGLDTAQGVTNDDPAATEGYFIGVDLNELGVLNMRRVLDPGGTPSLSPNIQITVPATTIPVPLRASGGGFGLDSHNDRLYAAQIFRNAITGQRTLWTAHANEVDRTGVSVRGGGRTGSRWYEIADLSTTPRLVQAGTLFDDSSTGARSYSVPAVAVSEQGHMVLGCSTASTNQFAGIAVAARVWGDPLGTIRAPFVAKAGGGSYNVETSPSRGVQRWGDYSLTSVDPTDGMTMWTVQEYCNRINSWGVQVIQLKAPPPATISGASPSALSRGGTVTVTLTGRSVDGSGFFDPGSSYPNRLTARVSGTGVRVRQARFVDPTRVDLDLEVDAAAPLGPRDITIVNPDGQTTTAPGALRVTVPGPTIDSVRLAKRSGKLSLFATGGGFSAPVTVTVDGVAFQSAASLSSDGREVVQQGKLASGLTIQKAIRRGSTVTLVFTNGDGGATTREFTRP